MTPELYAVIGAAIVLGGLILNGQRELRRDVGELRKDVGDLRERMARLEERMNTLGGHLNAMEGRLSTLESVIVQVFGGKVVPQ